MDRLPYDTDKSAPYLANYKRWFGHLRDRPISMLELGIQAGGSLRLWADMFPFAMVAGLDLNPSPVPDTDRIRSFRGFQQDTALLDRIRAEIAPEGFDVIIDDASHLGEHSAVSFWHLFPRHLKSGGLYILDDWSCGYWPYWPDGHEFVPPEEAVPRDGLLASATRALRSAARPVSVRINRYPGVHRRLKRAFEKAEGATVRSRFPSHDYGMVGLVKQIVDATAIDVIRAEEGEGASSDSRRIIDRIEITPSQVLVVKL
jgi:SAM-dependent methyltransferase